MATLIATDTPAAAPDFSAIKTRQQAMWASGDFAVIGTTLQIVGEVLCESIDLHAGARVLDVAAGNGNATLAAARRFTAVTSTDYVPALLERGQRRAEAEGLDVVFQVADAEALPYEADSFDVVLSTFGVMFAPRHANAAAEMMRVCRPGGRIGLASWTPQGFLGQLLRVVSKHVPPPAGVPSPILWGTDAHLRGLFAGAAAMSHVSRHFAFRYRSAEHMVDVFRTFYGPVHKAFLALEPDGQAALETDIIELMNRVNSGGSAGLVLQAEYLETIITK
jgi:ubiquinone/menaquinone biosynthesis C-methylase UbiE